MRWIYVTVVLSALFWARAGTNAARAAVAEPNVVVVLTDDQSTWDLAQMPNVQTLLRANGITYTHYVDNNPLCAPSRASILTGRTSAHDGVWDNDNKAYGGYAAFADAGYTDNDLFNWMHAAGYQTSLDGKFMNGYVTADGMPAGVDDSHIILLGNSRLGDGEATTGGYFEYATVDDGVITQHGSAASDYSTTVLGQDAVHFIDTSDPGRPLFLYYAPHAPHQPATPEPKYVDAPQCDLPSPRTPDYYAIGTGAPPWEQLLAPPNPIREDLLMQLRCETLLSVDDQVGDIVQALQNTGRLHNTLIIFASDNGFSLGQHDWQGKNVPFNESDTIPLVVRWDADPMIRADTTNSNLVEDMDLPATIAQSAGAPMPPSDGIDFLTHVRTAAPISHAIQEAGSVPAYCGLIEGTLKYAFYQDGSQTLYDSFGSDPYELDNLAGEPWEGREDASMRRTATQDACTPSPPRWTVK